MSNHGHIVILPSGDKARCGGPKICEGCAKELSSIALDSVDSLRAIARRSDVPIAQHLAGLILRAQEGVVAEEGRTPVIVGVPGMCALFLEGEEVNPKYWAHRVIDKASSEIIVDGPTALPEEPDVKLR